MSPRQLVRGSLSIAVMMFFVLSCGDSDDGDDAGPTETGSSSVSGEASGELADWQPILFIFKPDAPQETGPSELFCRDLVEPPPGAEDSARTLSQ